jgi:hypothetical protein
MQFILAELFFALFGKLYLFLRYRTRSKMEYIRDNEFDGSYSDVGCQILTNSWLYLYGILLVISLLAVIGLVSIALVRHYI